jgi:hypothetical protein
MIAASKSKERHMRCECLFCDDVAIARFTAPRLKPRFLICEQHLEENLAAAAPYRRTPGRVVVEPLCR